MRAARKPSWNVSVLQQLPQAARTARTARRLPRALTDRRRVGRVWAGPGHDERPLAVQALCGGVGGEAAVPPAQAARGVLRPPSGGAFLPAVRAPRAQALCKPTVTLRRLLSTAQHYSAPHAPPRTGKPGVHHVATPNFSPQTQKGRRVCTTAHSSECLPAFRWNLPPKGERWLPGGGVRPLKAS